VPEGISQRIGNRRIEKAIKSISSKAETDNIVAWFIWKRNFPKPLRPLMRLFFDSVSLIPNSNHLFMQLNEVFYLFLVVNNCLYHIGRLFMAFREFNCCLQGIRLLRFFSVHYNPRTQTWNSSQSKKFFDCGQKRY